MYVWTVQNPNYVFELNVLWYVNVKFVQQIQT